MVLAAVNVSSLSLIVGMLVLVAAVVTSPLEVLVLQPKVITMLLHTTAPEGRPGMSDVSPLSGISGLSFDSTLLSSLLFFCLILLPLLSYLLSACWPILLNFFQKILQYFSLRDGLFLYGSCLAVRRSKLVGGMCSMQPYGTGICCYAFI